MQIQTSPHPRHSPPQRHSPMALEAYMLAGNKSLAAHYIKTMGIHAFCVKRKEKGNKRYQLWELVDSNSGWATEFKKEQEVMEKAQKLSEFTGLPIISPF